jgi:type IV pilus assembly protein PilB
MQNVSSIRQLIDEHFSLAWCRENVVIPMEVMDGAPFGKPGQQTLVIAVGNITFLGTIGGFIKQRVGRTGLECQFVEKPPEEIQALLDQAAAQRLISGDLLDPAEYDEEALTEALKEAGEGDAGGINFEFDDEDELSIPEEEILNISNELLGSPLQRAVAQILVKAVKDDVSDIHIEPQENEYRVRLRQDGVLRPFIRIPSRSGIKLTAVLKTMAGMNVAERRASQDGRILRKLEGNKMEFRVSTLPSKYGEKTVLRVLKSDPGMLNLDTLVSNSEVLNRLRSLIHQSYGIIIVAGPTGSGKSTTLYSAISELNTGENNIVTAEDPIEYTLPGITQVQVLREKNQTFATILRTFLRQDPDVMLIGETRDPETAKASMEAAQTGHLVLTTLHANNSASSITRLLDMEVPHYLITSSLLGVLAQRLVRRLCTECSVSRPVTEAEAALTRLPVGTPIRAPNALSAEEKEKAKREQRLCNRCQGTGYKGRVGVYELMSLSNNIKTAIRDQRSNQEIQEAACQEGMVTLEDYARNLVRDGITSVAELQRVCSSAFD